MALLSTVSVHGSSSTATSINSSFTWTLEIEQDVYKLGLVMLHSPAVGFSKVIVNLKNVDLLAMVSEPITGGSIKNLNDDYYELTLMLKKFFITSELVSKCIEVRRRGHWKRRCELDTGKGAGKLAMIWKFDEIVCSQEKILHPIRCQLDIQGKTKDLKILGLTLSSASKIALQGKYQALSNFSKSFHWWRRETGRRKWDHPRPPDAHTYNPICVSSCALPDA